MADEAISALTATTSVSGSDLFETVQGGVNKKITAANLASSVGAATGNLTWLNVKDAPYNAAGTWSSGTSPDDHTALQNALDDVPSGGGVVYVPPGDYYSSVALAPQPGTVILCDGQPGVSPGLAAGTTQLIVASSAWGITIGSAGATEHLGCRVENLTLKERVAGAALGGVQILRSNNSIIKQCDAASFTAGVGIRVDGTGDYNQYTTLDNIRTGACDIGVYGTLCTGLRMIGGFLQGAATNNGSTGIMIDGYQSGNTSDTLLSVGTCVQGYEFLLDLNCYYAQLDDFRAEVWGASGPAIRLRGPDTTPATPNNGPGAIFCNIRGSANNGLSGGTGTVTQVDSGAVDNFVYMGGNNFTTNLDDSGTRTRNGGFTYGVPQAATSLVGKTIIGKVPVYMDENDFSSPRFGIVGWVPLYDSIT